MVLIFLSFWVLEASWPELNSFRSIGAQKSGITIDFLLYYSHTESRNLYIKIK